MLEYSSNSNLYLVFLLSLALDSIPILINLELIRMFFSIIAIVSLLDNYDGSYA
jgi:hypothetical protein